MNVIPSGAALGAEIQDVDLKNLSDRISIEIHRAWLNHLVVRFRGQQLTDEDLIAFSRRFGDLDWAPVQETGRRFVEGHPEIYVVSNVIENGVPIGSLGAGEACGTPTCRTSKIPPRRACCMRWKFLPTGGNTYFCNMYRAYESLPDALKQRIAGLAAQARRHLQQRRLPAAGRLGRERRSGIVARRLSSAGLHPSGDRPRASLSGPPAQRVHRRTAAGGVRSAAR